FLLFSLFLLIIYILFCFFFSSRRRHTRCYRDWSSDVCSSDYTVIFGHSTLPQLYNPNDYKTIFAHVHQLQTGDEFLVNIANITYTYKIFSITVVKPDDTSSIEQMLDDSYLIIINFTSPVTILK